jgi:nitrogenase iron protein NifH
MRKIAIYGKGGIGKSTVTSNLSAAIAGKGYNVMHIGCDPKADSTSTLMRGKPATPILKVQREQKKDIVLADIVHNGFNDVKCVECGGPKPGVGCAGRGIITAFEMLESLNAYETYQPDYVLYDVLGDVVCGGFAMPLRRGYAEEVYIVTSGEKMSLFAARNIAMAIENFKGKGYARLKGIILNSRNVPNEYELVNGLAEELDTQIVVHIPRDETVQLCEDNNVCVIEGSPESSVSGVIRALADTICGA